MSVQCQHRSISRCRLRWKQFWCHFNNSTTISIRFQSKICASTSPQNRRQRIPDQVYLDPYPILRRCDLPSTPSDQAYLDLYPITRWASGHSPTIAASDQVYLDLYPIAPTGASDPAGTSPCRSSLPRSLSDHIVDRADSRSAAVPTDQVYLDLYPIAPDPAVRAALLLPSRSSPPRSLSDHAATRTFKRPTAHADQVYLDLYPITLQVAHGPL